MRDDVPPWSFFLPVALAVAVGVLLADGVKFALHRVVGGPDVASPAAAPPPPAPAAEAPADDRVPAESLPRIAPSNAVAEPDTAAPAGAADAPAATAEAAVDAIDAQRSADAADPAPVSQGGPATAPATGDMPELPGPMTAMRDNAQQACIGGTVANRHPSGWEQALDSDRPLRCNASSP